MPSPPARPPRLLVLTLTLAAPLAVGCGTSVSSDSSCAALVELDGHTYQGAGRPRDLPTTGRQMPATFPSCDDGGGPSPVERVEVEELALVPVSVAVWRDGEVYVREDRDPTAVLDRLDPGEPGRLVGGRAGPVDTPRSPTSAAECRADLHVTPRAA